MRRFKVNVTTDGSGDAVAYTPRVAGKVHSIQYIKPGANAFSDGVDFTITAEATAEPIWAESNVNASAVRYPRSATHSTAGAASTYAATFPVLDKVAVASDRIKIVVAAGGAAKAGSFHVLID